MSKQKQLKGYYYAAYNYLRTPKGRHDAIDYIRAAVIIMGVAAILIGALQWWCNM
ncbi:hypothetical protein [Sporomusa silvacetica]|uniref:hypothetical protein n=1 Tax=Sporomusa silvacetica TaxID=55504 RepID=UPI001FE5A422|nr:hypothetical protein [Sporomusa silvacetica]